jgi:feruloyl esterase
LARIVGAGGFVPPRQSGAADDRGAQDRYKSLPSFCRVTATLRPTRDSEIKIEVWLPEAGWNRKLVAVGNGGWAGVIPYAGMASVLASGYATVGTDAGHEGNGAAFALGHPEKLVDMGYRAVHEMTLHAKAILSAYYGAGPTLSIWNGCSLGGRQGLTEAMRYPSDYDAIIAGAPTIYNMRLHTERVAINAMVHRSDDSYIEPEKYPAIHAAVLEACDARDGVRDGVLEDPTACRFDPKVLQCKGAPGPTCLTSAQVETARALYEPLKHPKNGRVFMPPLLQRGSELGWSTLAGPEAAATALEAFRYIVFRDATWSARRFNASTDIDLALNADAGALDFSDPNLKPFFDRGGKLLMYHGWSDPLVPPMNTVTYFNDVVKTVGRAARGRSIELYMVPGMTHCAGGPGTDTFDKIAAIERWVELGRAPAQIVASHRQDGIPDRTRPLCPYGQVAKWKGSGSTNDAANFRCAVN